MSTMPPETSIANGPVDGSISKTVPAFFRFSGADDVIDPADLLFECRLDDGPFEPCSNPTELTPEDGRRRFAVRAVDAAGNIDGSPALRT